MRPAVLLLPLLLLASCASQPQRPPGRVNILSTSAGQPLDGAACTVDTGAGRWAVQTPAVIDVGEPSGDLRVICQRPGYRSSEVLIRAGSGSSPGASRVGVGVGGGTGYRSGVGVSLGFGFPLASGRTRYPAQVVVDMTPLNSTQ